MRVHHGFPKCPVLCLFVCKSLGKRGTVSVGELNCPLVRLSLVLRAQHPLAPPKGVGLVVCL